VSSSGVVVVRGQIRSLHDDDGLAWRASVGGRREPPEACSSWGEPRCRLTPRLDQRWGRSRVFHRSAAVASDAAGVGSLRDCRMSDAWPSLHRRCVVASDEVVEPAYAGKDSVPPPQSFGLLGRDLVDTAEFPESVLRDPEFLLAMLYVQRRP